MKEAIALLRQAEEKLIGLYSAIAPGSVHQGGSNFADKDETVLAIREFLNANDKSEYITIYESISGWTAVHIYWNTDGFWEPWQTGFGKYETSKGAENEGRDWARAEGIRYVHPKSAA